MRAGTGPTSVETRVFVRPGRGGPPRPRRLLALALVGPPLVLLQLVHWVGFGLDRILFPGFRRIRVREPLFVVGLPRSGTTFLHRVLARDEARFTTLKLWELVLAPSITERKVWSALFALDRVLGGPGRRLVQAVERRAFRGMEDVHPVTLDSPEEDYLFLLPVFACFLLVLAFPTHPRLWALSRLDEWDPGDRRALVDFYHACVQRHLYVVGADRQLLSKNPSFTPFIEALAERFPDARFIGCVRDPRKVVPSQLSSLAGGARAFGWNVAEPAYRDRIVEMLVRYAECLLVTLPKVGADRHAFTVLSRLRQDVPGRVQEIYATFGWNPDPAFLGRLDEEGGKGRAYRSGHRYTLDDYGLDEGELMERFLPLMTRFGLGASRASAS